VSPIRPRADLYRSSKMLTVVQASAHIHTLSERPAIISRSPLMLAYITRSCMHCSSCTSRRVLLLRVRSEMHLKLRHICGKTDCANATVFSSDTPRITAVGVAGAAKVQAKSCLRLTLLTAVV